MSRPAKSIHLRSLCLLENRFLVPLMNVFAPSFVNSLACSISTPYNRKWNREDVEMKFTRCRATSGYTVLTPKLLRIEIKRKSLSSNSKINFTSSVKQRNTYLRRTNLYVYISVDNVLTLWKIIFHLFIGIVKYNYPTVTLYLDGHKIYAGKRKRERYDVIRIYC